MYALVSPETGEQVSSDPLYAVGFLGPWRGNTVRVVLRPLQVPFAIPFGVMDLLLGYTAGQAHAHSTVQLPDVV